MSDPAKFRKKPVVIEAMQWDGSLAGMEALKAWSSGEIDWDDNGPFVQTLEGVMRASDDDWAIRGVKGEHYFCKPDIFDATYEPVKGNE